LEEPNLSPERKNTSSSKCVLLSENKVDKFNKRVKQSKDLQKTDRIKVDNLTYYLNKTNNPNYKNSKVISVDDNENNLEKNNIINLDIGYSINQSSNKEKEYYNNPKLLDLIPKKKSDIDISKHEGNMVDNHKETNNNLSKKREEERLNENHSSYSNQYLKHLQYSAKNISFASDNKHLTGENKPITSTFILSSCMNDK